MKKADVQAAYISWLKSVDDQQLRIEIAKLATGAFDPDDDDPSQETIDLLIAKHNWEELDRLGYADMCPEWYLELTEE